MLDAEGSRPGIDGAGLDRRGRGAAAHARQGDRWVGALAEHHRVDGIERRGQGGCRGLQRRQLRVPGTDLDGLDRGGVGGGEIGASQQQGLIAAARASGGAEQGDRTAADARRQHLAAGLLDRQRRAPEIHHGAGDAGVRGAAVDSCQQQLGGGGCGRAVDRGHAADAARQGLAGRLLRCQRQGGAAGLGRQQSGLQHVGVAGADAAEREPTGTAAEAETAGGLVQIVALGEPVGAEVVGAAIGGGNGDRLAAGAALIGEVGLAADLAHADGAAGFERRRCCATARFDRDRLAPGG